MNYSHPREFWQLPSEPVHSGSAFEWSDVDLFVIHWPGFGTAPASTEAIISRLRSEQHDYLTNRGFSLGYNSIGPRDGTSYEVRGTDFECAANRFVNSHAYAHQLQITFSNDPEASKANDAQVAEVRRLVRQARQESGRNLRIVGHTDTVPAGESGTSCPGPGVLQQIRAGVFEPQQEEEHELPVSEEQYNATIRAINARIDGHTGRLNNLRDRINNQGKGLRGVRNSLSRFRTRVTDWLKKF